MAPSTREYGAGEALRIFGGIWIAARDGVPTRHLGGSKPPLVAGRPVPDWEAEEKERRDLEGTVRLPEGTPRPGQTVHVATAEDFLSLGLRIVRRPVLDVAFSVPPRHLAGSVDLVAASVRIEGVALRVPVRHDAAGRPSLLGGDGVSGPWAHLVPEGAEASARAFAARVADLADWEARAR